MILMKTVKQHDSLSTLFFFLMKTDFCTLDSYIIKFGIEIRKTSENKQESSFFPQWSGIV